MSGPQVPYSITARGFLETPTTWMGTSSPLTSRLSRQRWRRLIVRASTARSRATSATNTWWYLLTLNIRVRFSMHPSQLFRLCLIHSRFQGLTWALAPLVSVCQSRIRLIHSQLETRLWLLTESQLP